MDHHPQKLLDNASSPCESPSQDAPIDNQQAADGIDQDTPERGPQDSLDSTSSPRELPTHDGTEFKEYERGADEPGRPDSPLTQIDDEDKMDLDEDGEPEVVGAVEKNNGEKKKSVVPLDSVPTRFSDRQKRAPVPIGIIVDVPEKKTSLQNRRKKTTSKGTSKAGQMAMKDTVSPSSDEDDVDDCFMLPEPFSLYSGPGGPKRVYEQFLESDPVYEKPFWKPEESDAVVRTKISL